MKNDEDKMSSVFGLKFCRVKILPKSGISTHLSVIPSSCQANHLKNWHSLDFFYDLPELKTVLQIK